MKAIAAPGYGPLEGLVQIDTPLPVPGRGEVRVRVIASALNPADYKVVLGTMKFLHGRRRPLMVGYDYSGVVDEVGPGVRDVRPGDEVFGFLPYSPGNQRGAFAEALIARADGLAPKPAGISHERAASAATTGLAALQSLRDLGRLPASGGQVLVTGCSGAVGSIGIGVARRLGATVTAVGSGAGLERARQLGASAVVDRTTSALPGSLKEAFDVVFDTSATYRWRTFRPALKPGGAFVSTLPSLAFAVDKLSSLFSSSRVHFVAVQSRPADLRLLSQWLLDGLEVPVAHTVPVREVARALSELQRAGGRVVVRVAGGF